MNGLVETAYILDGYVNTGWARVWFRHMSVEEIHAKLRQKHESVYEGNHWGHRQLARVSGKLYEPHKHLQ